LSSKKYDEAQKWAEKTKQEALELLKGRKLDADRHLPIALGAAIETQAQAVAAQGDRAGAIEYLAVELETYRNTSIRTRLQKNINLLGLEGKPAPGLQGASIPKGKPALLFFWAHWCGDCKSMIPTLQQVKKEFPNLTIIGPTQLYGYAERGREVEAAEERAYIARVHKESYSLLPAPVSAENFKVYGASTTPTLVLVDSSGIVRMYHPGEMSYDELAPRIQQVVR
jgi:thiol-disulfide isomerase/thioredoxin